ncbi:hypothetical protein HK097_002790, partial [Rhizophlyctis rosea]
PLTKMVKNYTYIDQQDELDKLLNELSKEPSHPYHSLPEDVKKECLREVQLNICEKALNDAFKKAFPQEKKARKPRHKKQDDSTSSTEQQ